MSSKLGQIRYDENVAVSHSDARRTIYDPEKILEGIGGIWHRHNIIALKQGGLELGNHYHDYEEIFFTPTGEFSFGLVDLDDFETREYSLKAGNRILIPEGIGHIVIGKSAENVLMGYGSVPFDPKRLIRCEGRALETLASLYKKVV